MNLTAILVWPNHMDFPLWRMQVIKYRRYLGQILVVLSNNHEPPDISEWIKDTLGQMGIPVFSAPELRGEDDWRDRALKQLWGNINNRWIWFTEQDFFIKDESFFKTVFTYIENHDLDMVCYREDRRLHPACIFVKKSLADKTNRDFSPIIDKADHFYKFTENIKEIGKVATLDQIGLKDGKDFYHLKGLTHNFQRLRFNLEPTGKNEFATYNHYALEVDPQNALFLAIEQFIEETYGEGDSKIAEFFKPLIKS